MPPTHPFHIIKRSPLLASLHLWGGNMIPTSAVEHHPSAATARRFPCSSPLRRAQVWASMAGLLVVQAKGRRGGLTRHRNHSTSSPPDFTVKPAVAAECISTTTRAAHGPRLLSLRTFRGLLRTATVLQRATGTTGQSQPPSRSAEPPWNTKNGQTHCVRLLIDRKYNILREKEEHTQYNSRSTSRYVPQFFYTALPV